MIEAKGAARRFATACIAAVMLTGCGQKPEAPRAVVQQQAEVQTVEVLVPVAKTSAFVALARGSLPDGCARLGEAVVSPGGRLIVVILPAYSGNNAAGGSTACGGPASFERIISLGSDFSPGAYTVTVNGVSANFDIAEEPAPAAEEQLAAEVKQENAVPVTSEPAPAAELASAEELPSAVDLPVEQPLAKEPPAVVEPAPATLPAVECEDKAAFFADVSVPDGTLFAPGDAFTKTWRIRNAGGCTWKGYTLVFQDGDLMSAPNPLTIAGEVQPGDTVDISLNLTAPQKPGTYYSDWLISTPNGRTFGLGNPPIGLLWTKIGVRSPALVKEQKVCAYQTDTSVEAELLRLVNQARQENGLPALQAVEQIGAAARAHAQDMACTDFVEHYGSDGSTWYTRIKANGVNFHSANENIFAGSPQFGYTAQGVFKWWMNSQIHRENILNPKSKQIGAGYVYHDGSSYKGYYTLNFVEP